AMKTCKAKHAYAMLLGGGLAALLAQSGPAAAFDRGTGTNFAVLPDGSTGPEGSAVAANGDVYVATFGFNKDGPVTGEGKIYAYGRSGNLLRQLSVSGSSANLLGIAFHPTTRQLLVIDFGNKQVL